MTTVTVTAPVRGVKKPHDLPAALTGSTVPVAWPGSPEPVPVAVTGCVFTDDDHTGPVVHVTLELPDDAGVPSTATGEIDVLLIYTAQSAGPVAFHCDLFTIHPTPREVPA